MRWPRSKAEILEAEVAFLRAQVAQLQNYILVMSPTALAQRPPMFEQTPGGDIESTHRLFSDEIEDDLEYQVQEGIIDEDTARAIIEGMRQDTDDMFTT